MYSFINRFFLLSVLLVGHSLSAKEMPSDKKLTITLPVVAMGGETRTKVEWNLKRQGSLSLEGGRYSVESYGTDTDHSSNQNSEFIKMNGYDFKAMIHRYSNGSHMSGFFWGLGVGSRRILIDWNKENSGALDHYLLEASGTIVEARLGFRYVAKDLGLILGVFGGMRYFRNSVHNVQSGLEDNSEMSVMTSDEQSQLSNQLRISKTSGVEVGWAF